MMMPLELARRPSKVLLLGAHADDIEIGCGGTVLQWLAQRPDLEVCWVVFSADEVRAQEARASAARFLGQAVRARVRIENFQDGFFPAQWAQIKCFFEALKREFDPDLIFTHHERDRHQDHRTVAELTWNTWRGHLILAYEIPKYDGDLGEPNVYLPLHEDVAARKCRWLREAFPSQGARPWFDEESFRALLRLRGLECGAPQRYAEAFHGRKLVLGDALRLL